MSRRGLQLGPSAASVAPRSIGAGARYADDALQEDKYEAPAEGEGPHATCAFSEGFALARKQEFTGLETDATHMLPSYSQAMSACFRAIAPRKAGAGIPITFPYGGIFEDDGPAPGSPAPGRLLHGTFWNLCRLRLLGGQRSPIASRLQ
jgi:hypothetical protein